jgi:branched-chain amino acid transport system substrate-binding protein
LISRRHIIASLAASPFLFRPSLIFAQSSAGSFRIGALNPVTGAPSYGAGMQKMIIAAADAVNKAGGAAGRKIEVFAEDSQANPQAGVLAAKKLIEINKVQAVLGTWASPVSLAVVPLTNDANIFLMNTSGAPALSKPPANAKGLSYRFQATNDRWGAAFAELAEQLGFKRAATMSLNNPAGLAQVENFKRRWESRGNRILEAVVYEPNQASYRSELQRVLNAQPDLVVLGSYQQDATVLLREWYQTGTPVRWMAPTYAVSNLAQLLGPDVVEGVIAVDTVSNETAPSFKVFDEAYRAVMQQPGTTNPFAAMTWDMVIVLALAIEAAQSTETAAINAKIREIGNPPGKQVYSFAEAKEALKAGKINYEGASSILDFDENGDVKPDFGAYIFEKGKLVRKNTIKI